MCRNASLLPLLLLQHKSDHKNQKDQEPTAMLDAIYGLSKIIHTAQKVISDNQQPSFTLQDDLIELSFMDMTTAII